MSPPCTRVCAWVILVWFVVGVWFWIRIISEMVGLLKNVANAGWWFGQNFLELTRTWWASLWLQWHSRMKCHCWRMMLLETCKFIPNSTHGLFQDRFITNNRHTLNNTTRHNTYILFMVFTIPTSQAEMSPLKALASWNLKRVQQTPFKVVLRSVSFFYWNFKNFVSNHPWPYLLLWPHMTT